MFQPVGGMDRIPVAFAKKARPGRALRNEVTVDPPFGRRREGVHLTGQADRQAAAVDAAYCIVTIPLRCWPGSMPTSRPRYRAAIHGVEYGNAVKIAWQSRRFWEIDEHIYGGISWVKGPTDAWCGIRAIELFSQRASCSAPMPLARCRTCLGKAATRRTVRDEPRGDRRPASRPRQGAREADCDRVVESALQPRHRGALLDRIRRAITRVLSAPDGPFYFAGEHLVDRCLAGRSDPVRPPRDQHDRQAPPCATRVKLRRAKNAGEPEANLDFHL